MLCDDLSSFFGSPGGCFRLLHASLNLFLGPITAAGALAGGGTPSQKLLADFRNKTIDFEYSAVFGLIFYATVFFSSFGSPDRFSERPQVHFLVQFRFSQVTLNTTFANSTCPSTTSGCFQCRISKRKSTRSVSHRCCEFRCFATICLRSLDLLVGVLGLLHASLNLFLGPITVAGALAGGGRTPPPRDP